MLGVLADAGTPDGAITALVVRPASWLRLHAGGGTNSLTSGWRGGATLLPLGSGPSLNVEMGHYGAADTNGFVRTLMGAYGPLGTLYSRMSYTYTNAQLGLDFGGRYVTFYLHAGAAWVNATLYDVSTGAALRPETPATPSPGSTTVAFNQNPTVRTLSASMKLGFIFYLP
jgi:hypothetical protein